MNAPAREVLTTFLRLGLSSFGGPLAHTGYFHREFVTRRRWLEESTFAQLLALSQFLPGPASSQLGFSIGLLRAGWAGALLAFVGFTLPSALIMSTFVLLRPQLPGPLGAAAMHGLGLVAVAAVAYGVFAMAQRLCTDTRRSAIALAAAILIVLGHGTWMQITAILFGALAGIVLCRDAHLDVAARFQLRYGARLGWSLLVAFAALLVVLPAIAAGHGGLWAVAAAFYRAGAFVFGGGHVVLPLLEQSVVAPGWVSHEDFLAGYGAAQAVPGPMFTLAAYLGAILPGDMGGSAGALCALISIFLPGLLLVAGVLPVWRTLGARPLAAGAIAGVNAAVVGLLAAALYSPVGVSAIHAPVDVAIVIVALWLLRTTALSTLLAVGWCVAASIAWVAWAGRLAACIEASQV
jgi:chromate transporter